MQGKVTHERAPGTFTLVPLILFSLTTLAGWWYVTQRLAEALGHQSQLGEPWFTFRGAPIYEPWKVLTWNYWYHSYAPEVFNDAMKYVFGSIFVAIVVVIVYAVFVARRGRVATTYGSAKWADQKEMEQAGLLGGSGVVLGSGPDGRYLMHDGPENIGIVAPPRSGKGAGPIISTLLTWGHSVVVNDIRKENWEATAGYRAKFSNVIYFNPTDPLSAHFNPLFEVRKGPKAIADAQNVADMIVDPDGTGKPDHWDKTSHALLVAAILHILYAEEDKGMRGLSAFLADPERDMITTLHHMLRTDHGDPDVHLAIASAARENLNRSPNELSGVMSTAMSFLGLYRDPIIAKNTADSDFCIQDLIHSDKPVSLYMVIPPSEMNRTRPLRRLIWAQIGRKLMEEHTPMHQVKPTYFGRFRAWLADIGLLRKAAAKQASEAGGRRRVLLLADEFPALGRMDFFETQLAYTGGYGIKAMIVAQSRNQIDKVYGNTNSILDLCHVRVFFTPNDDKTAETISALTGTKTEVHQQKTYTGHRLAPWLAHVMIADQEVARPLLTPGEVLTFPAEESLVFVAGHNPMRARKLMYFSDPNLKRRVVASPNLDGRRPYPYRPRPRPGDWDGVVAAESDVVDGAVIDADGELQDLEKPIEPEAAQATAKAAAHAPELEQDLEAEIDQAIDVPSADLVRRVAFDELQQDRRERSREHRHRHNDPDLDRAI